MSLISLEQILIENIQNFLGELIEIFPEKEDLYFIRLFIIEQFPTDRLIDQMTKYVVPHKDKIKNKDEAFFLESRGIFGILEKTKNDKVLEFKELWKSSRLDKENRNTIWAWFDAFICIVEEYNKLKKDKLC